jgi:hypothetical protein
VPRESSYGIVGKNRIVRKLLGSSQADKRFYLTKQYVIDALIENIQKALGRKPIRVGKGDKAGDVYVYEGAVANASEG